MTRREKVSTVLSRSTGSGIPTQINYTDDTAKRLAAILHVDIAGLDLAVNNHLLRVDIDELRSGGRRENSEDPGRGRPADGVRYDMWGVGFSPNSEGYMVVDSPLNGTEIGAFVWPEIASLDFSAIERRIMAERSGLNRFVLPNQGFSLFERAWALCGFEDFLTELYTEPRRAETILEEIAVRQVELAKLYVAAGVDGGYFGDDLGTQSSLLFDPNLWRRLFKPRMARMFAVYRDAGLPVILHSDGAIMDVIPDLIDIGLSCLNPCQPEILPHPVLVERFGRDIAFYGGVSTQAVMPHGTKAGVRASCDQAVKTLRNNGTGLLFGPSHRLMSDVPDENLLELIDYVRRLADGDC